MVNLKILLIIIPAYLVAIFLGSLFVSSILKILSYEEAKFSGIRKAGLIIGIFERFITLTFVLLNQYSGIAFIFTSKSIARFEELKNREFAEYYLIGTLSSLSFAIPLASRFSRFSRLSRFSRPSRLSRLFKLTSFYKLYKINSIWKDII